MLPRKIICRERIKSESQKAVKLARKTHLQTPSLAPWEIRIALSLSMQQLPPMRGMLHTVFQDSHLLLQKPTERRLSIPGTR